jgi:putative methyltransferase (TIGR04325 family)
MKTKEFVKLLTPPILVQAHHALRNRVKKDISMQDGLYLAGNYSSWAEALAASTGYDSEIILEKTRAALLKVKRGEAVYERDSVLFDEIQYSWPLLAGLMWAAAQSGGRLNVLDFGGSLGTTYFQNRRFLERLPAVRWNIIEQPRWAEVGKADFEDEHLKFYGDINACLAETQPNVIVLSSVLQYLEQPFEVLRTLSATPCNHLIVDRTPFWDGPADRLCVQYVPASIYAASYPSWIFSLHRFRSFLNESWEIVAEFDDPDRLPGPVVFGYKGIIATRRDPVKS